MQWERKRKPITVTLSDESHTVLQLLCDSSSRKRSQVLDAVMQCVNPDTVMQRLGAPVPSPADVPAPPAPKRKRRRKKAAVPTAIDWEIKPSKLSWGFEVWADGEKAVTYSTRHLAEEHVARG